MMKQSTHDRIQHSIHEAARRMVDSHLDTDNDHRATPGDLYLINPAEIGIEWLVVRYHPDDDGLVCIVPVDSFPLHGQGDVVDFHSMGSPEYGCYTARCGASDWIEVSKLLPSLRVGIASKLSLSRVRQRLAQLARGVVVLDVAGMADADPEYIQWMDEVDGERLAVTRGIRVVNTVVCNG